MACNTDAKRKVSTVYWKIQNFSYCWHEKGSFFSSPDFKVKSIVDISWNIRLYPRGYSDERFISFFLCGSFGENPERKNIEYEFQILAENDTVLHTEERLKLLLERWMKSVSSNRASVNRQWKSEILKEAFLSQDTLRIRCTFWRTDGIATESEYISVLTAPIVNNWEFTWNIGSFSSLGSGKEENVDIKSNCVEVTLNIEVIEEGSIEVTVKYCRYPFAKFHSFLTGTNGIKIDCGKSEVGPEKREKNLVCKLPFTQKYLMDNKDLYLKDDVLSLCFECSWSDRFTPDEVNDSKVALPSTIPDIVDSYTAYVVVGKLVEVLELQGDFHCLYDEDILSDVMLRTETETFHAHKAILSRSPVFRERFNHPENMPEVIHVLDMEDGTLCRLLLYVYTNSVQGLQWESASNLYVAADKYKMVDLKSECFSFMRHNICLNNVCDALYLADRHDHNDLKAAALHYIFGQGSSIFHSKTWNTFEINHSRIAVETILLVMSSS